MKICCIKTEKLPLEISGTTGAFKKDLDSFIKKEDICWIERQQAETDFMYKQLIPYVLVKNSEGKFACYPRHGTEKRVSGLYSCGIGGHIDEPDKGDSLKETVETGLYRELSEELAGFDKSKITVKYLGVINEIISEVGLVHLGIVYYAECLPGYSPVATAETAGMEWLAYKDVLPLKKELWSELAFRLLMEE